MISWLQKATTWSLAMSQLPCVTWAIWSDPFQEEFTLLHLQFLRQILQPTLSSHSRGADNDLMLLSKAEIQVRTGILSLSNLHLSWYNFAVMNQSFRCNVLNFRPEPGQSHLVNVSFNATTVRRIGMGTEGEKRISKSSKKRKCTRFSAQKRELWEKVQGSRMAFMLQNASPSTRLWRKFLTLKLSPLIYYLHLLVQGGLWRGCACCRVVWKGRNRAGEGSAASTGNAQTRHWNPDLSDSSAGAVSGPGYHISASASPAAQQQLLYNHWILFLHCITMAPGQRFLEGDASREREPQLWSCSVQVKWNWPGLL